MTKFYFTVLEKIYGTGKSKNNNKKLSNHNPILGINNKWLEMDKKTYSTRPNLLNKEIFGFPIWLILLFIIWLIFFILTTINDIHNYQIGNFPSPSGWS